MLTGPGGQSGADPGTGGILGMIGNLFSGGGQGQTPAPATDHEGFLTHLFGGGQAASPASPSSGGQGSDFPGFLDNPLAKVVMGGVAAYGAKQIADQYSKR